MKYFLVELESNTFVVAYMHGAHAKAATRKIKGGTFANRILEEFNTIKGFANMSNLAQYLLR